MLIDFTPLLLRHLWVLTSWAAAVPGVEPVVLKVSSSIFSSSSQHVEVSSGKILNWVSPLCIHGSMCACVNVWLKVLGHRHRQEWWCCFPVWSLKSCFELEVSYLEHDLLCSGLFAGSRDQIKTIGSLLCYWGHSETLLSGTALPFKYVLVWNIVQMGGTRQNNFHSNARAHRC